MSDREFLIWLHERLEHVHGEDPLTDYMHRLRAIIWQTSDWTSSSPSFNGLEQLKKMLDIE